MYKINLNIFTGCLSIRSSTSYVLLAANIEDFRSLAKRLAPENIAEQIIALAGDPQTKAKIVNSDDSQASEQSSDDEGPTKQHVKRGSNMKNPAEGAKYEFQLDDLVARVKERLQKELIVMATSTFSPEANDAYETTSEPTSMNEERRDKLRGNKGSQSQYIKRPQVPSPVKPYRDEGKHKEKDRYVGQERYVQNKQVDNSEDQAVPESKYLDQKKRLPQRPRPGQPQRFKKVSTAGDSSEYERKQTSRTPAGTATEDIFKVFQGIDMFSKKDSYEDYVTPKKDDNYDEPNAERQTEKTNSNIRLFTDEIQRDPNAGSKNLDAMDEDSETINYNHKRTTRDAEEVRTPRHNKLRNVERPQRIPPSRNLKHLPKMKRPRVPQQVQPLYEETTKNDRPIAYAEQLTMTTDYDDETPAMVTDEVKARTESIPELKGAAMQPDYQSMTRINISNPNIMNRKIVKIQKAGTVIPKRDFYKMSSPNYVAKLPKVAESYKFDEPIPERDREPEQLDPIGNPPASINGKVRLS